MRLRNGLQQREPCTHIGPSTELEFADAQVIRWVDVDQSGRIDAVSGNNLCCFS